MTVRGGKGINLERIRETALGIARTLFHKLTCIVRACLSAGGPGKHSVQKMLMGLPIQPDVGSVGIIRRSA